MLLCQILLPRGICCGESMAKLRSTIPSHVALSVCKQVHCKSEHCKHLLSFSSASLSAASADLMTFAGSGLE